MYTTESLQGFFFMHKSRLSCFGSVASWKHRCLEYIQAVQHGSHCIWRCDRLSTWRKIIKCICTIYNYARRADLSHSDKSNNDMSWLLHVELFAEYYPVLSYKPRRPEDRLPRPINLCLWCRVLSFFALWHSGYCIGFVCSAACNLNRVDWTPSDHKNFDYACPGDIYW